MTRDEQIKKAEIKYSNNTLFDGCDYIGLVAKEEAFIAGAKWADENPQFSKEEFIEKACEWLEENVSKYSYVVKVEGTEYRRIHFTGALTEDFSKAMEEK